MCNPLLHIKCKAYCLLAKNKVINKLMNNANKSHSLMNILKPYLGVFSYLILLALLSIGLTAMSAHSHNIDLNHIGDELEAVGFK